MKPGAIRLVERYVGMPLCFVLTLCRRIAAIARRRENSGPPRRVLFLKLIEQGATVLAWPAMRMAVGHVGRENAYFCVFRENRQILDELDVIPHENVFEIRNGTMFQLASDMVRFILFARRERIDCIIDMEFFSRGSAVLAYLAGARLRVGYHRFTSELPYRGDLMTHRFNYDAGLHVATAYLLFVAAAFGSPEGTAVVKLPADGIDIMQPRLTPTEEIVHDVRERIAMTAGRQGHPVIVLHPNTTDLLPVRRWDGARYLDLIGTVCERWPSAVFVLTGSSSEQALAAEARRRFPGLALADLSGKTTLRQLMALYHVADVHVTADCGPGHFASLYRCGNIVLFGPETPVLFAPLGGTTRVLYRRMSCSPCLSVLNFRFSPCDDNRCMQAITVDDVFAAVSDILEQRHRDDGP